MKIFKAEMKMVAILLVMFNWFIYKNLANEAAENITDVWYYSDTIVNVTLGVNMFLSVCLLIVMYLDFKQLDKYNEIKKDVVLKEE